MHYCVPIAQPVARQNPPLTDAIVQKFHLSTACPHDLECFVAIKLGHNSNP